MTQLETLIQTLCPNGVKRYKLKEIAELKRGVVISKDYINEHAGEYPVYSSQTENNGCLGYIDTYAYDGTYLTWTTDGANAGTVFYREGKFNITNVCGLVIVTNPQVSVKYLYYILSITAPKYVNRGMGNPKLMSNVMQELQIPLPPLAVQSEIVRILDKFTLYKAELAAELAARCKQYEHYRNQLLTFDENTKRVKLGEVAEIGTGSSNTNEGKEEGAYPFYVRSQTPLRKDTFEYDATAIITAGDGVGVGKVFHFVQGKYALHQRAYRIHPTDEKLNPKYLYFYMVTMFADYIHKTMFHSSVSSIRRPMLTDFPIPLPPLEIQEQIVAILDRFDALCNDIKIGLPAEIDLRQKQYEHYRDKLLTFEAKG